MASRASAKKMVKIMSENINKIKKKEFSVGPFLVTRPLHMKQHFFKGGLSKSGLDGLTGERPTCTCHLLSPGQSQVQDSVTMVTASP